MKRGSDLFFPSKRQPPAPVKSRPIRGTPVTPATQAKVGRTPFHTQVFNEDLGTYIEDKYPLEYTLCSFTAPKVGAAVITAVQFFPNQVVALLDLTIIMKRGGSPLPYLSPRYGRIGTLTEPEEVNVRLEPGQVFKIDCYITQDYRQLDAVDQRIRTVARLWGFYETGV